MPDKNFLHQHSEFEILIGIIARQMSIDPYLVEKDYWIMHCLFGLQEAGYDFQLKGGTSLSKGYKIIHRFSEDIDIHITPPAELNLKTGKNHNKLQHVQGRKNYYDILANEITIRDIKAERDTAFDDEKHWSGGIRLNYVSHFNPATSAAKEGVLLELGFSDVTPNKPITISSWAYDHAASKGEDMIDNRAKNVLCYEPGYTFVEKLQAISTKYRQWKESGASPHNFMRHYYDIYCLLQDEDVKAFAKTQDFEVRREKHFPRGDFEIPLSENQAFLLSDPKDFGALRENYVREQPLYYRGLPDFEEVIGILRKWVREH